MKKHILIVALLAGMVKAADVPLDYQKWKVNETTFRVYIGGEVQNYQKVDSTWAAIETNFLTEADTLHTNRRGVLKTDVNNKGQVTTTFKVGGTIYTVADRLVKMIWINTSTWNWTNIGDTANWSAPSVLDDVVKWTNVFPGIDYAVTQSKSQVRHTVNFKPGFLDSAVALFRQRADSNNIWLGSVQAYILTNVDNADSALGNVDSRILKRAGSLLFRLPAQYLQFPGSDSLKTPIPVRQRWIKQAGKLYCVELVNMKDVARVHEALPTATLWHNTSAEVTQANCDDAGFFDTKDWANRSDFNIWDSGKKKFLLRGKGIVGLIGSGSTITACSVIFKEFAHYTTSNLKIYGLHKPNWIEGRWNNVTLTCPDSIGATGTYWDVHNCYNWGKYTAGTSGCDSAADGVGENSGDSTGADRYSTAAATVSITGPAGTVYRVNLNLSYLHIGDSVNVVLVDAGADFKINTTKATTTGDRPFFVIVYTTGGAAAPMQMRRRKIIMEQYSGVKNDETPTLPFWSGAVGAVALAACLGLRHRQQQRHVQ